MEARIHKAHKEAVSDTCSGFLYTLWLKHPEMDFSFFNEEAVEEVKRYAVEAANDTEASALLDPSDVAPLIPRTRRFSQPK